MSKKIVAIMIALLFIISATACEKSQDTQEDYKANMVRVARQRNSNYSSATDLIIEDRQLLEKYLPEGVAVEWSIIPSATDQRDALVAGEIDIGGFSSAVFIAAVENGFPLVALSDTCLTKYHVYVKRPATKTLKDFEHLAPEYKISSTSSLGNNTHLSFMAACKDVFGDARKFDSHMVGMQGSDVLASVSTSDEIAVALMAYPFGQEAQVYEVLEPIFDLTPYAEAYSARSFATSSQKFYDENPVLIEAYIQARKDAIEFIGNKPDEAAESLKKYWDTYSVEEIKELLLTMPMRMEISESGYDKLAEFMYELELIPNQPKKFSELPNYDSIPKIK